MLQPLGSTPMGASHHAAQTLQGAAIQSQFHAAEDHMQHDVLFALGLHVARRCNRDTHQPVPFQGLALCQALVSNRP